LAIFIPEDKISQIKNAADLVDVVSEVVLLKKAGKNHLGLCPFHSEKTPSFTVSPEKQIFYCFGCGAGGNVFSFLMKQGGLSFPEAARMLARRYGIEIPTQTMSAEQKRRISEKESLFEINRLAMDFFRHCLVNTSSGKKAMAYLKKRGMTNEIITGFQLGYAPEGWDNIVKFFSKKRISHVLVEKAGLIVARKENPGFYDRFRDRILFPIFNTEMQVVGFGGRVMDDAMPKYLNSPETPIYNKSRSLYGLHRARSKCRESETVYIAEGYFDLLALHQHGMEDSVATLGTALTAAHVRLLKGYARRVILVYDSDDAGIKAALRSIGIFMDEGVDARILVLPVGYDPDSYIFKFGSQSFMDAAGNALGIMAFLMDAAEKRHGLSIEGKIRIISDMKAPLASINDSVARSLYIKELAERLSVDEAAILEKVREKYSGARGKTHGNTNQTRGSRLERRIIAMMLQFPEILSEISSRSVLDLFEDNILKSIGQFILTVNDRFGGRVGGRAGERTGGQVSEMMTMIDDEEKRHIIALLSFGEDVWDREGCIRLLTQFESSRDRREKVLLQKIKAAEDSNDQELLLSLLREKQNQARRKAVDNLELSGG